MTDTSTPTSTSTPASAPTSTSTSTATAWPAPVDVPVPDSAAPRAASGEQPVPDAQSASGEQPAPPPTVPLDARTAAELLGRAPAATARGFLGLDPVTQNPALMAAELTRQGAQVLRHGDALLGYAPNPLQPRQARVATTSVRPEPLDALLGFLHTYHRCSSFTAEVTDGSPVLPALAACGFTEAGRLPQHVFRSGRHHDVLVHHAVREG